MRHCTLLIPRLWWSRDAGAEVYRGIAVPNMHALLTRARQSRFAAIGWEGWLCQAFEVERQLDWPVAPLTLSIDGGEPGEDYWLRADPVHLRAHRDRLVLADSNAFTLSRAETDALVEALNAHFGRDGLRFTAPSVERWYLGVDTVPRIITRPLDDAAGTVIDPYLPSGPDAVHWHRILNEAQMLLHAQGINEAREARDELPVNGVWLWGGGRRVAVPGRHFLSVTADDPLAVALAASADVAARPLDRSAAEWLAWAPAAPGMHLIVLSHLIAPARRGDVDPWRTALESLDVEWIAPLLAAMKRGKLGELALVAPGDAACLRFDLRRADLFRFWRARRSLSDFLAQDVT